MKDGEDKLKIDQHRGKLMLDVSGHNDGYYLRIRNKQIEGPPLHFIPLFWNYSVSCDTRTSIPSTNDNIHKKYPNPLWSEHYVNLGRFLNWSPSKKNFVLWLPNNLLINKYEKNLLLSKMWSWEDDERWHIVAVSSHISFIEYPPANLW